MEKTIEKVIDSLIERISGWSAVDTVTLIPSIEDHLADPYFFLSIDVFHDGTLPGSIARHTTFVDAGAFETSLINHKDRFLLNGVPIRLEYKHMRRIEQLVDFSTELNWSNKQWDTYLLFRITNCRVLYSKSDWFNEIKSLLRNIPAHFWHKISRNCFLSLEHQLLDIKAAEMENDTIFFTITLTELVKNLISFLFLINSSFQPANRFILKQLATLPIIPPNIVEDIELMINHELGPALGERRIIAERLIKELYHMAIKIFGEQWSP